MSLSDKIFHALEKEKFEVEDDGRLYKSLLTDKVSLYFEKEGDAGGPYLGIWMVQSLNSTIRNNLKTELHNIVIGKDYSDVHDVVDGNDYWIWCDITAINDSIVDKVISTMVELGRRTLFTINQ
jgi:hypothetical protein